MNLVQMSRSLRLRLSIVAGESFNRLSQNQYWHGCEPVASSANREPRVRTRFAPLPLATDRAFAARIREAPGRT